MTSHRLWSFTFNRSVKISNVIRTFRWPNKFKFDFKQLIYSKPFVWRWMCSLRQSYIFFFTLLFYRSQNKYSIINVVLFSLSFTLIEINEHFFHWQFSAFFFLDEFYIGFLFLFWYSFGLSIHLHIVCHEARQTAYEKISNFCSWIETMTETHFGRSALIWTF